MNKKIKRLNLGSGKDIKKDWVNLDYIKYSGVDVAHDLNKFPYPFRNNTFDYILAKHVIEHMNDLPPVLRELYRIMKPNGILEIHVPHYKHKDTHIPMHKLYFNDYFFYTFKDAERTRRYLFPPFKLLENRVVRGKYIWWHKHVIIARLQKKEESEK